MNEQLTSPFTEENIQRLFGNEAGESESIERLKEYYFKTPIFDQVASNLPLRILVGHKGIGKSALFKIAMDEDPAKKRLPILIRPDDIYGIAEIDDSLLSLIKQWKLGLLQIIGEKIISSFGIETEIDSASYLRKGSRVLSFLAESILAVKEHWNLDHTKKSILEHFLKSHQVVVYIDDLDRGWEGRRQDIKRVSALLNAARDLSSDLEGLSFRISLRSDVYYLVRTSDESTDKVETSVIWYSWTNHEILTLLAKRVQTFFDKPFDDDFFAALPQDSVAQFINSVVEPRFFGRGNWQNIPTYRMMMSLIRRRPRDLVKLCTLAARQAFLDKSNLIGTKHFESIFSDYSLGRIQDAVNEYKTEMPEIQKLLFGMKPTKKEKTTKEGYVFRTDEILQKLTNLSSQNAFIFADGSKATPKDLLHFLYKINFLTARMELPNGTIDRKYFEENRYISGQFTDFGYAWEIHPAYRWALQPENIQDIISNIEK